MCFTRSRLRFLLRQVVTLAGCMLLLAACSDTNPTGQPSPVTTPIDYPVPLNSNLVNQAPFTLTVWFAEDYYNEPPIVDLIKDFKRAYPNISVVVQHYEWNKLRSKVKDAVMAGQPPDVAHQHAFAFGAQGFAEPLDDLWAKWGTTVADSFIPGAMEDVTWSGVRYGVPLDINTVFLFYNKQMFQEAGLALPDDNYTFSRLREDAQKLTKPDGSRYGIAFKPGSWDTYGLIRSNGGELLDENGTTVKARLDNPANVKILQFVSDMINKDRISPKPNFSRGPDPVEMFKQRKIAMFFSGPWDLKAIEKSDPTGLYLQIGTATMPKGLDGNGGGSVLGGGSLFVPKGARHREAAFEFMKWASNPRYQRRLPGEMGRYPVISNLYNDLFFTSQPILKPYLAELKIARPYKLEAYSQADITWEQSVAAILTGSEAQITLQDANLAAQSAIRAVK